MPSSFYKEAVGGGCWGFWHLVALDSADGSVSEGLAACVN